MCVRVLFAFGTYYGFLDGFLINLIETILNSHAILNVQGLMLLMEVNGSNSKGRLQFALVSITSL